MSELVPAELEKEGFLFKNHAGATFKSGTRRWFASTGFNVTYYATNQKKTIKGHFDLRNVVSIKPSTDKGAGEGSIELNIAEKGQKTVKVMIIAFRGYEQKEREVWLRLWCSAVVPEYVAPAFKGYIDAPTHDKFNGEFGDQGAVSRKRASLTGNVKKPAPKTSALTPRESFPRGAKAGGGAAKAASTATTTPAAAATATPSPRAAPEVVEDLDTPRGQPPERDQPPTPTESAITPAEPLPAPAPPAETAPTTGGGGSSELAADETFEITVPAGVEPGQRLQATTPGGVKVKLVVPAGAQEGMLLTFQVPKQKKKAGRLVDPEEVSAAISIQSAMRGRAARASLGSLKAMPVPPPGSPPARSAAKFDEKKAALVVQRSFRGHTVRNDQQESARLQWMNYYAQPDVAEWSKAFGLAVTPEEEEDIRKARRKAETAPVTEEEVRRREWLKHYIASRDFTAAREIALGAVEEANILKASAMATRVVCSCLPGGAEIETQRVGNLADAIRTGDFAVAEILAMDAAEHQDVAEARRRSAALTKSASKGGAPLSQEEKKAAEAAAVRVQAITRGHMQRDAIQEARREEWMEYYTTEGEYAKALELAVYQREINHIKELQAQQDSQHDVRDASWLIGAEAAEAAEMPTKVQQAERPFVTAIREYNWAAAEALAEGGRDYDDLRDSKLRVEWMGHYASQGEYDKALEMCITAVEMQQIEVKRRAEAGAK